VNLSRLTSDRAMIEMADVVDFRRSNTKLPVARKQVR